MQGLFASLVIAASTAAATGTSSPSALAWSTHYGRAKERAHQHQRPLLVVVEDPAHRETRLNERLLATDRQVVERLRGFQLCRVDVNTDYGKRVAEALGAQQLPYTAITDRTATFITFRNAGPMNLSEWRSTLAKANEAVHPSTRSRQGSRHPAMCFS